ncbi:MAG: chorismate synthase [Bacteroidales bacterium]|nr:chorismate synthase [Bacteroidales bacterium]MDD4216283.1 chorismate synthase [Bacteroidales bacterium]MDY0141584.1 chorismate synthase [Bacteroidales bacterium]
MNSFGSKFRISIYGESHGEEVGVIIDGCPPGIKLSIDDFEKDIARRTPGQVGTSDRIESDKPLIKSGIYNGFTTGTPIAIAFFNNNFISEDYNFDGFYRPGHADFTANIKYNGFNNPLGGGHFSGRLTLPLVAAGVIAKKILQNIKIQAKLIEAGGNKEIEKAVKIAIEQGDSIGGIIECEATNVKAGYGEPFFDSVESVISHLAFAIPGLKAIEFGEGLNAAKSKGSEFNDVFIDKNGTTATNNSGGINGGISNGNTIYFRLYFKPSSSISKAQTTYNFKTNQMGELKIKGRHDACYALRVPVIAEAITAIALASFYQ